MSKSNPILTTGGTSAQGIREAVTTARHAVGTKGVLDDGREFRYARNSGAALVAGQLCQAEAIGSNFINVAVSAAAAVGATSVSVTLGGNETILKDEYANGYLVINDAAGEGLTYLIRGNAAITSATAFTVELDDEIAVALTTSSEACVLKNPFQDVVIAATGHVHQAAGVPQFAVGAGTTDPQYFWLQTNGISAGWDVTTTAVGAPLQSGATAGQLEVNDGAAQYVGDQLVAGVATEYRPKNLRTM